MTLIQINDATDAVFGGLIALVLSVAAAFLARTYLRDKKVRIGIILGAITAAVLGCRRDRAATVPVTGS